MSKVVIDVHGVLANLWGGQQLVLEEMTGVKFDPALFAGGTNARKDGQLEFIDLDGTTVKVANDLWDHAMDVLFRDRYLDYVLPIPGAVETVNVLRQRFGRVEVACKTGGDRKRSTYMTQDLLDDFMLRHGFEIDDVRHFTSRKQKVMLMAEAHMAIDNELDTIDSARTRGLPSAIWLTPAPGMTGHMAITVPAKMDFGTTHAIGCDGVLGLFPRLAA